MIGRLLYLVDATLPTHARVGVVSKGDDELLRLGNRWTCHFPEHEAGVYAGSHPADSAAAILCLESLREREVDYLVFPNTAFWWLDFYDDFRTYLEDTSHLVVQRDETCRIYALSKIAATRARKKIRRVVGDPPPRSALELDEVDLRVELASLLVHQGSAEEAIEALNEGLTLEPQHPRLHTAMARCAAHIGDHLSADRHMADARIHVGDDLTPTGNCGRLRGLRELSLTEDRIMHVRAIAPSDPLPANCLILLSVTASDEPGSQLVDRLAGRVGELLGRGAPFDGDAFSSLGDPRTIRPTGRGAGVSGRRVGSGFVGGSRR